MYAKQLPKKMEWYNNQLSTLLQTHTYNTKAHTSAHTNIFCPSSGVFTLPFLTFAFII